MSAAPYRAVAASRGAGWIVEALVVLRRAPLGFHGACLLVAMLMLLPPLNLLPALLLPALYAGMVAMLRAHEAGTRVFALHVLGGFTTPGAFARLLPLVVAHMGVVLATATVVSMAVGPELQAVADSAGPDGRADPERMRVLLAKMAPPMLAMLPLVAFWNWVLTLAIPRAMLDEAPGLRALREAAGAVWVNFGAFLVNLAGLFAVSFAALSLVTMLMAAAQALGLGAVGVLAASAVFFAAMLGLNAALMRRAAADIFIAADAPPPAPDVLEA